MVQAYEDFSLWFAKSLGDNQLSDADLIIANTSTPDQAIKLIYCIPLKFAKRATDVTSALAVDPDSPDTGTGMSDIVIRFSEERTAPLTNPVLEKLIEMFYNKGNDDIFRKGRFGLVNKDNPKFDVIPIATAGYKFLNFGQDPNAQTPGIQTYNIQLKFLGDHTKLGTRA